MSTNAAIAEVFAEMAAMLELTGANSFRVSSYQRAARVLNDLTADITTLAEDPKQLTELEGIGKGTAEKIVEYLTTGRVQAHEKLAGEVPGGLLDLLKVPGMGPKTVRMLWEQAGVTDLPSLQKAMDDGTVESLPRMGKKTVENIREAIAFLAKAGKRMKIGVALPLAEQIIERVRAAPGVKRIEYAGSLRRGRETIGDLDIVVATDKPKAVTDLFRAMPDVERILVDGSTKVSVRLVEGAQADLRVVDESCFGAALMYFTGSKEHNVALRERAQKRGLRLNEYGLFPEDDEDSPPQERGIDPVVAETEAAIYAELELPWYPPEMRESRGELNDEPPKLVALEDIGADLHAHTTASDGHMSIEELARLAESRGLHTIAVTDHSPSSAQANGLSPERLKRHIDAIREADATMKGITILAGSEVDIHADGTLDYDDEILALLDIVVASPHASLRQERGPATKRLLRAIEHPLVHIIGHPTGRIVNRRSGLDVDIEQLAAAAVEHDTALEINANFNRLDLRDTHVRAVVEAGGLISINTDTHREEQIEYLRYGVLTARRGWLRKTQCVNAWTARKLRGWLRRRR